MNDSLKEALWMFFGIFFIIDLSITIILSYFGPLVHNSLMIFEARIGLVAVILEGAVLFYFFLDDYLPFFRKKVKI